MSAVLSGLAGETAGAAAPESLQAARNAARAQKLAKHDALERLATLQADHERLKADLARQHESAAETIDALRNELSALQKAASPVLVQTHDRACGDTVDTRDVAVGADVGNVPLEMDAEPCARSGATVCTAASALGARPNRVARLGDGRAAQRTPGPTNDEAPTSEQHAVLANEGGGVEGAGRRETVQVRWRRPAPRTLRHHATAAGLYRAAGLCSTERCKRIRSEYPPVAPGSPRLAQKVAAPQVSRARRRRARREAPLKCILGALSVRGGRHGARQRLSRPASLWLALSRLQCCARIGADQDGALDSSAEAMLDFTKAAAGLRCLIAACT